MLSTSCKYALRAAVFIMAQAAEGKKLGIKEIAENIEANEHTTAKILQLLAKEGIIHSTKGPNGGFYLLPDAAPVYLIDIVQVIDGTHFFFECGLGLKQCSESKPCPIHHHYKEARELLYKEFSTITIQELSMDLTAGKAFLKR
jgi:Rrf2 family protein